MNIILGIIGYLILGFVIGIAICMLNGKEWCRANTLSGVDDEYSWKNNAECIMYISTFLWVLFILFSPFIIIHYIVRYTSKKLQE